MAFNFFYQAFKIFKCFERNFIFIVKKEHKNSAFGKNQQKYENCKQKTI